VKNTVKMSGVPQPRLCHIKKWPHFNGYGFNLHGDKNKPGQLIGKVDEGSPAQAGGLKIGDRIIEIEGVNVIGETHKEVVGMIMKCGGGNEVRLLVADRACEAYHDDEEIDIESSLDYVLHLSSEQHDQTSSESEDEQEKKENEGEDEKEELEEVIEKEDKKEEVKEEEDEEEEEQESEEEEDDKEEAEEPHSQILANNASSDSDEGVGDEEEEDDNTEIIQNRKSSSSSVESVEQTPVPVVNTSTKTSRTSYNENELVAGLNLNMTAKQMRQKIGSLKKRDPRVDDTIDIKKKHEIIKNL